MSLFPLGGTMSIRSLAVVLAVVGGSLACSSDGGSTPSGTRDCTPEATRACTCTNGSSGSQLCSSSGFWQSCTCGSCPVTPSCVGKVCGADDGCGNACLVGTCPTGEKCNSGVCKAGTCVPECTGKACGDPDLCGGICTSGTCAKPGFICNAGTCECKPVCTTCGGDDTCGGKCMTGSCAVGYKCSTGTCAVDPASKWIITVTKGTITTDGGWNTFSGPDAMVCLWIGGRRVCTQDSGDTLAPSWGCAFPAVAASTLMAGVDVEMFDNDRSGAGSCGDILTTAPGEAICTKGTVPVSSTNFTSKTWSASCKNSSGGVIMSFTATLTPM